MANHGKGVGRIRRVPDGVRHRDVAEQVRRTEIETSEAQRQEGHRHGENMGADRFKVFWASTGDKVTLLKRGNRANCPPATWCY